MRYEGTRDGTAMLAVVEAGKQDDVDPTCERAGESELKYLSFLSHDLNNNLSAVHLHLQLLKERLVRSPEFSDDLSALEMAQQSIRRTTDGMQRLLSRERLRKDRTQPRLEPVALHELVTRIAVPFRATAARKGVGLGWDVDPRAVVNSDADLITLVLQNLIGNGVKYSARGEVRIASDRIHDRTKGDRWAVLVSDEGPGIPPRHLTQIFNAFWRGEVRGNQGIGLGLAIASEAAKRLGAELSVESQVGAGTSFRIAFSADASQFDECDVQAGEPRYIERRLVC